MSDKYIIKNCPAFVLMRTATSGTYFNICGTAKGHVECKDCTDCKLKQIVELCKDAQKECSCKNPNKDVDCFECTSGGRAELGTEILKRLDVQEVE